MFELLASAAPEAGKPFGDTPDMQPFPLEKHEGTTELFPMPNCFGFELEEATIDEMQDAMANGKLTSVQLVQTYMMRHWQTDEYIK